jgi:6-phosphogluconolactonase
MEFCSYPDRDMLMMRLADMLASDLNQALRGQPRATLSVPGGTTPGPVFDTLSGVELEWNRIDVILNDERWVPESNPRSNTALLRQRLLRNFAAEASLIPLYADTPTPEEGLPALIDGVRAHLPISVLLLGMGADMHTASLFPGADQLAAALASDAPPLLAMRAAGAAEPRITLTAPVLQDAMNIHILITGSEKREALNRALRMDPFDAPVAAVLANATVHWAE